MPEKQQSIHGIWRNRWTFIFAATGSAVGLGNIWKFPYIAGENGGGAFVLVYLACILAIGVPIMIAEILLGRHGQYSPITSMRRIAAQSNHSKAWVLLGWFGALAGFLILSYYSVVAGWALAYIPKLGFGEMSQVTPDVAKKIFEDLLANPLTLVGWHTVFILLTAMVVARGVNKGLEKAVTILMPMLFLLLVILLGYSMMSGNFQDGLDFLFTFDFNKLTWDSVLEAMGHAFFTLSLGMGAIMAYGAYMPKNISIINTSLTIAFFDTLVAIIAGLVIFPIVFANGLEPGEGPGLMFVSLPIAFGHMGFGAFFGVLFFILVTFAAWSSAISLIEPSVAWAVERFNTTRFKATFFVALLAWVLGLGSVLSFNHWENMSILDGRNIFATLDFLTTNIMLPLGGLLIALFVGWVLQEQITRKELSPKIMQIYQLWRWFLRLVAPVAVLIILTVGLLEAFPEQKIAFTRFILDVFPSLKGD